MLYIFDKDGTICRSISGQKFINSVEDQELIPGVKQRIEELKADGHSIAIASNQGGVGAGHMEHYEAYQIIQHASQLIGAHCSTFCPFYPGGDSEEFGRDSLSRKPNPGMILECAVALGFDDPHEIMYIGDRPEDKEAAQRAGVSFMWADDFFGR